MKKQSLQLIVLRLLKPVIFLIMALPQNSVAASLGHGPETMIDQLTNEPSGKLQNSCFIEID